MAMARHRAPWKNPNPKQRGGTSRKLTAAQISRAKKTAAEAGRPYPNLVDNMHAMKTPRRARHS